MFGGQPDLYIPSRSSQRLAWRSRAMMLFTRTGLRTIIIDMYVPSPEVSENACSELQRTGQDQKERSSLSGVNAESESKIHDKLRSSTFNQII